jgi:hypothetical protein
MTLGELIHALRLASSDPVVLGLVALLEEWRANASTADDLWKSVEKYLGNSWFSSDEEHKTVYVLWSAFRDECIAGRPGMTMEERLYCFDLLEAWDSASTEQGRAVVRHKVDFVTSRDGA